MFQAIGSTINERRLQMGISQEQLCNRLCSQSTLSKIESGEQIPRADLFSALTQRLGLPSQSCIIFMNNSELEQYDLQMQFHHDITNMNYADAEETAKQLCFLCGKQSAILKQFLSYTDILLGMNQHGCFKEKSRSELLVMMLSVVKQTVRDLDLKSCHFDLLTMDEIRMINTIGWLYSTTNRQEKAIEIYTGLLKYCCGKTVAVSDVEGIVPSILFNLGRSFGLQGRYEDCVDISRYAEDYCIKHTHTNLLGFILYNKGCALYFLGQKKESQKIMLLAHTYLCCNRQHEGVRQIAAEIKEFFGIELEGVI